MDDRPITENCRLAESWLHEEFEDYLAESARPLLQQHLDGCVECQRLAADLRRLSESAATLPRAIEPARDLWAEISPRLTPRPEVHQSTADQLPEHQPQIDRLWWQRRSHRAWQAIAALLFMVLGAWLGRLAPAAVPAPAAENRTATSVSASIDREPAAVEIASIRTNSLDQIEVDYLRAKESLWLELMARQHELEPATLELVSRNLWIINQAIQDLRRALELEPGQPQLEALLLAQHQREVELLQRFVRLAA